MIKEFRENEPKDPYQNHFVQEKLHLTDYNYEVLEDDKDKKKTSPNKDEKEKFNKAILRGFGILPRENQERVKKEKKKKEGPAKRKLQKKVFSELRLAPANKEIPVFDQARKFNFLSQKFFSKKILKKNF